jgi:hypothetical protein
MGIVNIKEEILKEWTPMRGTLINVISDRCTKYNWKE